MIIEKTIFGNKSSKIVYELTLYAFKTEKGTFTLSATCSNGTDEWRELGTKKFHTWQRQKVYEWFKSGNIEPIEEANTLTWYLNTFKPKYMGIKNKR